VFITGLWGNAMNCADNLIRDHDDIIAMLPVVVATTARIQQHRYIDAAMLDGIDRFLEQFIAEYHFKKEDTLFFPHVRRVLPDEAARTQTCSAIHAACLNSIQELRAGMSRARVASMETGGSTLWSLSARCVHRLATHVAAERPILDRIRRHLPHTDDPQFLNAVGDLERHTLGATGREWYAQLVLDYADIARSWSTWPAMVAASGTAAGESSAGSSAADTGPEAGAPEPDHSPGARGKGPRRRITPFTRPDDPSKPSRREREMKQPTLQKLVPADATGNA
jgi:hemerythrin-like domain-containing protein